MRTILDRLKNIETAIELLDGVGEKLAQTADQSVTSEVLWALSLDIADQAKAVLCLVRSDWQAGVVEIVRSQMEACADFILLARDDEYFRTLLARQDEVVVVTVNRSKASKTVPGIKRALRDQAKKSERPYESAFGKRYERNKLSFVEAVAKSQLSEDYYRLFCAYSHHNVTTLNSRYMIARRQGENIQRGRLDPLLLEAALDQCLTNCTKPLFETADRIKRGQLGVPRGFPENI